MRGYKEEKVNYCTIKGIPVNHLALNDSVVKIVQFITDTYY